MFNQRTHRLESTVAEMDEELCNVGESVGRVKQKTNRLWTNFYRFKYQKPVNRSVFKTGEMQLNVIRSILGVDSADEVNYISDYYDR